MKRQVLAAVSAIVIAVAGSCTSATGDGPSAVSAGGAGTSAGHPSTSGSSGTPNAAGMPGALGGSSAGGAVHTAGAGTSGSGASTAVNGGTAGGGAAEVRGGAGGGAANGGAPSQSGNAGAGGASGAASGGAVNSGTSGSGGARPVVTPAAGTTLVKIDAGLRHQTFEGWGTSLCWWANHVGGWREAARNAVVDAVVNPTTGLGYNIFRYNIGGGENPAHEHMQEHREMPGFQAANGTWNWEADANQRAILQRIVAMGSDVILEAFSNSPPYWMTKSGCASGSSDGFNNLKDDAYDDFADYLTEVVKHYKETFGVTFRTLEPLNEPNANWWKSNGSQEGCHFSPSSQQTLIQAVASELSAKGLSGTVISASDENSMDDAYNNLRAFSSTTMDLIGQLNVHSYAGSKRKEVRQLATSKGKRLWQSESGPLNQTLAGDTEAALFMAGRIIADLRDLQPEAWIDWQVGDPSRNWASILLNDAQQSFTHLKRFYMHAGFSRFIRPGAVFVDVKNNDMVAALSADGRSLTLVVRNGDTSAAKRFTIDLTTLPRVGASAVVYRTSRTEDLVTLPPIAIENYSFVVTAPAYSVTTFVIPVE